MLVYNKKIKRLVTRMTISISNKEQSRIDWTNEQSELQSRCSVVIKKTEREYAIITKPLIKDKYFYLLVHD